MQAHSSVSGSRRRSPSIEQLPDPIPPEPRSTGMKTLLFLVTSIICVGFVLTGCAGSGGGASGTAGSSTGATNAISGPGGVGTSEVGAGASSTGGAHSGR